MGCPGLEPALLGSDMKLSVGPRENATPVLPATDAGIYSRRPSRAFRVATPPSSYSHAAKKSSRRRLQRVTPVTAVSRLRAVPGGVVLRLRTLA
jgi:hypothetical protein